MVKGTYLFINFAIIFVPLLLSFEKRVFFFHKWLRVFFAIAIVGSVYVFWDVLATNLGHWWFNPRYVLGFKIGILPFEEILFFVTAPFSCLFIYEVISFFHQDKPFVFNRRIMNLLIVAVLSAGFLCLGRDYTALSFWMLGLFLFIGMTYFRAMIEMQNVWIYLGICYLPFSIFNGILTSLPIVSYHPRAILGLRVGTIPVEDFFYNLAYLGFILIVYKAIYFRGKGR